MLVRIAVFILQLKEYDGINLGYLRLLFNFFFLEIFRKNLQKMSITRPYMIIAQMEHLLMVKK